METREPILSRDLDFYKLTMSQLAFEKLRGTEATFTFKNRGKERLSAYVVPGQLRERFDAIREQGWQPEEIAYNASLMAQDGTARFTPEYLDHLADQILPEVEVGIDRATDDIAVSVTGELCDATFWETTVMTQLNEIFYQEKMRREGLNLEDLY